ncbi:hypothetical protein N7522_012894 [Penicillium canescens]|nr:hypothetical protein N7522_012894 [Penicillium canescens]
MAPFMSALDASSYQSPDQNGSYSLLREKTVQAMIERGLDRPTLAEYGISWGEDQDPFGHVMAQTYPHIGAKSFTRLLESFQEQLKDRYPDFMAGRGISVMTNRLNQAGKRMVKYPDLLISGIRIAEVQSDRFFVIYSIWSVSQNTLVCEVNSWIVFVNQKTQKKVNIIEEGGEYSELHASLVRRAAESQHTLKIWEEKQKARSKTAKL